jgi:ATP-dependent RNA helicase RhlE
MRRRRSHPAPAAHPAPRHAAPRAQAVYDPSPLRFDAFGLRPELLQAVEERAFETTTPVQSAVIPIALAGHDVIGCAATGTGKTAAFLLPIIHRLLEADAQESKGTKVLILAPTRELAVQIDDDVQGFIYHTNLTSVAVYGGVEMGPQERALRAGVDLVVATPGRLMDHMRGGATSFDGLKALVLDEADRMMDMGFWPDVRRIVQALPPSAARQTMLFSATMPDEVMRLAHEVVRDAKYVQLGSTLAPADTITHTVQTVASAEKAQWLAAFLKRTAGPVLVFVRTKSGAERLSRRLAGFGLHAAALHADRTQSQRTAAIEGFKAGRYRVLVATDVAARGLDVDGITHVVNFEVPTSQDTYVHRVGRTGRAEATGTALTLAAPEERRALLALERTFGLRLQCQ